MPHKYQRRSDRFQVNLTKSSGLSPGILQERKTKFSWPRRSSVEQKIGSLALQATPLIVSLADQIVAHIRTDKLADGDRLVERKLAEQLRA